jgi:hypothetical protein
MVEQVPALLEHVAERRLGLGNSADLLFSERVQGVELIGVPQLAEPAGQPGLDYLAHQFGRRGLEADCFHGPVLRYVDGVVQAILDVAIQ